MRIVVSQLPDSGQTVTIEGAWALSAARRALEAEPIGVGGQLHVACDEERRAIVTGSLTASAPRTCERCGEEALLEIVTEVDLRYAPQAAAPEPEDEDAEPAEDDDILEPVKDEGWYVDDKLMVEDVVTEALTLALPVRIVCADVPACDARTAELLASKGTSGSPGGGPFARLRGIS